MAKILVVDDDARNLRLAVTALEQAGHEVLAAEGGAGGRVSGVVLVFRDVTVERRAEQVIREYNDLLKQRVYEGTAQLRASEAQLQTVFENLAEGAW